MKACKTYAGAVIVLAALVGCDRIGQLGQLPPVEVRFSPKGGCTEKVVEQLQAARKSIYVQAYSFTSTPIAKALADAHRRGVHVEAILDRSQETGNYSEADFLEHAGITTYIDARHAIAHNKIMVIDGQIVITGSFNFTKQAEESNAENLLVIHDAGLAAKYATNWQEHLAHSEHYDRAKAAAHAPKPDAPQNRRSETSRAASSVNSIPRF